MSSPEVLRALAYVSSSRNLPTDQELRHLLLKARANNEREGVTGVLLYCDGNFMQYIEGPGDALERVFGLIRADRRHHGLMEIYADAVDKRAFAGWTMAYASAHKPEFVSLSRANWQVDTPVRHNGERSPALSLLLDFWERHQRSRMTEGSGDRYGDGTLRKR